MLIIHLIAYALATAMLIILTKECAEKVANICNTLKQSYQFFQGFTDGENAKFSGTLSYSDFRSKELEKEEKDMKPFWYNRGFLCGYYFVKVLATSREDFDNEEDL